MILFLFDRNNYVYFSIVYNCKKIKEYVNYLINKNSTFLKKIYQFYNFDDNFNIFLINFVICIYI